MPVEQVTRGRTSAARQPPLSRAQSPGQVSAGCRDPHFPATRVRCSPGGGKSRCTGVQGGSSVALATPSQDLPKGSRPHGPDAGRSSIPPRMGLGEPPPGLGSGSTHCRPRLHLPICGGRSVSSPDCVRPPGSFRASPSGGRPRLALPAGASSPDVTPHVPFQVAFPPEWPERSPPLHSASFIAMITFHDPFMKIFVSKFHKCYYKK